LTKIAILDGRDPWQGFLAQIFHVFLWENFDFCRNLIFGKNLRIDFSHNFDFYPKKNRPLPEMCTKAILISGVVVVTDV